MANLKFEIDSEAIAATFGELRDSIKKDLQSSVENLANMTHAKVLELARDNLKSLAKQYSDGVSFSNPEPNLWIVSLDEKLLWIEEGRKCIIYGKQKDKQPKVLTPDGERWITDIAVGDLVLNQNGKWTKVKEVYDEHIVEKSKYSIEKVYKVRDSSNNYKLRNRKYIDYFKLTCPICGFVKKIKKLKNKDIDNGLYCEKCLENEKVVKIKVNGKYQNNDNSTKSPSTMYLTGDHLVMTQRGWIEAWNLQETDILKIPSWTECSWCKKPVEYGHDMCLGITGASKCENQKTQKKLLDAGKHISQSPDWLSKVYSKTLKGLKKISGAEEAVAGLLEKNGLIIDFYHQKTEDSDCIRQYPVKSSIDRLEKQHYYYLDFYFPKLNLCVEVDGKIFHCKEKDEKRDKVVSSILGCQTIRIPAKKIPLKNFYKTTLYPILQNHSGNITYMGVTGFKLEKINLSKYNSINRRWDITVEDGESFVCNKTLIHNSGSMVDDLLKKGAKVSKDGHRYKAIPFEHSKAPTEQTPKAQALANEIKAVLKKQNISWKKIEYGKDGSPRIGRLHQIDIPSARPTPKSKDPALKGVAIYQSKTAGGGVRRDVMTFRIVSDKHKAENKWVHPGRAGDKLLDKSFEWAMNVWEREILPAIFEKYK